MYKYMLNYVVKISVMSAEYFEYYTVILKGGAFFSWTRCREILHGFRWYDNIAATRNASKCLYSLNAWFALKWSVRPRVRAFLVSFNCSDVGWGRGYSIPIDVFDVASGPLFIKSSIIITVANAAHQQCSALHCLDNALSSHLQSNITTAAGNQ